MTNKEKYINAFVEGLEIDASVVKEGLTFRRLEHTVTDVYEWMKSVEEWELKAGISREREKMLLDKWYEIKRA